MKLVKKIFSLIVLVLCAHSLYAQYGFDTIRIHFDIGNHEILSDQAKILDSVIQESINSDRKMMIFGYADYLGANPDNQSLSDRRAHEVNKYLLEHGLPAVNVIQYSGVGQVSIKKLGEHGNLDYRKVDIFLKRKEPTDDHGMKFYVSDQPLPSVAEVKIDSAAFVNYYPIAGLEVGETFVLKNINFLLSRSTIEPNSIPYLQELLELLKAYPNLKIKLEGHVCCIEGVGDSYDVDRNNNFLSSNRAETIYKYLINNGITSDRLGYIGFGKRYPLYPLEKSSFEAQENRRVEVRIIAK